MVLPVAAILISNNAGAVILVPGTWILTPATGRRLRIPSPERRRALALLVRPPGRSPLGDLLGQCGASSSAG